MAQWKNWKVQLSECKIKVGDLVNYVGIVRNVSVLGGLGIVTEVLPYQVLVSYRSRETRTLYSYLVYYFSGGRLVQNSGNAIEKLECP